MIREAGEAYLKREAEAYGTAIQNSMMRKYATGATRSSAAGKPEYAGYLHPDVIKAYGHYMLKHQTQEDGQQRDCRNHKKGMPTQDYMQSMFRHFLEVWTDNEDSLRDYACDKERRLDSLMALLFNVMGYAHNIIEEGK